MQSAVASLHCKKISRAQDVEPLLIFLWKWIYSYTFSSASASALAFSLASIKLAPLEY